jgi:hypothetical protein
VFKVPFPQIAVGHRAKYGHWPVPAQLDRAERMAVLWDQRLAHQLRDLPTFARVIADLRATMAQWESRV